MRSSLVVVLLLACAPDQPPDPQGAVVGIGAVIDQTGSLARPAWRDSAELAIEHANAGLERAGGWNDLVFVLRFSDSTNDPEIAAQRASALVRDRGAVAIVTDTSTDAVGIGSAQYDTDETNDLDVPIVCMGCPSPELNDPFAADANVVVQRALRDREGWIFRTSASSDPEATALLNAAYEIGDRNGDGTRKVAIFVIDDDFGNAFFESIQEARDRNFPRVDRDGNFLADGIQLEIVRHDPDVDANTYDWQSDLARLVDNRNEEPEVNPLMIMTGEPIPDVILDGEPDVIMEVTFPLFAASMTRAYLEDADGSIPFLHHHNWRHDTTLVKLVTLDIEGQSGISHAVLANCESSGAIFSQAIIARTGTVGIWDAQTYDAVMAIQLAVLIAMQDDGDPRAITGERIRAALPLVSAEGGVEITTGPEGFATAVEAIRNGEPIDYLGASGPVDFDENGDVRNDFVRYRVSASSFETELVYGCVSDPDTCAPIENTCD
jgi:hypothetical protein